MANHNQLFSLDGGVWFNNMFVKHWIEMNSGEKGNALLQSLMRWDREKKKRKKRFGWLGSRNDSRMVWPIKTMWGLIGIDRQLAASGVQISVRIQCENRNSCQRELERVCFRVHQSVCGVIVYDSRFFPGRRAHRTDAAVMSTRPSVASSWLKRPPL